MNDVSDVICTLLLCKYPSIDAVYEYTVPCTGPDPTTISVKVFKVRTIDVIKQ